MKWESLEPHVVQGALRFALWLDVHLLLYKGGHMKSHVSDLLMVAESIIYDATAKCTTNEPARRDLLTLKSRVKHEGLSFLTITLPSLAEDFERSLSDGRIEPTRFRSFKKHGKAPAFLRGIFALVFDVGTGRIHDEPAIEAIESIRQIGKSFKKLLLDCTPKRVEQSLKQFTECERIFEEAISPDDTEYFKSVSRIMWDSVLSSENLLSTSAIPRHGPGATADGFSGNQKYLFSEWHDRLEPYFPLLHFAFSSESAWQSNEFEHVKIVDAEGERPVKVTPVPKTLKGPRIIAIEPVCMQYAQQALASELISTLERHPLTRGHINFSDQTINRRLAMKASLDGRLATLDLSEASDRVPLSLATVMLDSVPDFRDAVLACRSTRAQTPDGRIIGLKKFASMGSALCFPIEAMYFYTICVGALLRERNLPVTYLNVRKCVKDVYVYGDDIIVPTDEVEAVAGDLQKYYCKVNMSKSFWTGRFRESCGMDAFAGMDVTPTYVRQLPPSNRRSTAALISWTKTANLFYQRGYWQTSSTMLNKVESILGKLPIVGERCAGLGKVSFQRVMTVERQSSRYHRPEVKTWVPAPSFRKDEVDGYNALTKCLLSMERRQVFPDEAQTDVEHLVKSARYGAVTLKRRWTAPY